MFEEGQRILSVKMVPLLAYLVHYFSCVQAGSLEKCEVRSENSSRQMWWFSKELRRRLLTDADCDDGRCCGDRDGISNDGVEITCRMAIWKLAFPKWLRCSRNLSRVTVLRPADFANL